jgi:hypothetical protein
MAQRDREAFDEPTSKPKIPAFKATNSKDFPGFLIVFCPRADCPGTKHNRPFIVHKATWLRPHRLVSIKTGLPYVVIGRSCPYCFRVGRLPRRSEIA